MGLFISARITVDDPKLINQAKPIAQPKQPKVLIVIFDISLFGEIVIRDSSFDIIDWCGDIPRHYKNDATYYDCDNQKKNKSRKFFHKNPYWPFGTNTIYSNTRQILSIGI
jgi:hypothetical protein